MKYTHVYTTESFGDNVTDNEADNAAEILAEMISANFGIDVNCTRNGRDGLDVDDEDLESEILDFINANWQDAFESESMEWDLRGVYEDNAGGLWAEYGDGQLAEILNENGNGPEDIEANDWVGPNVNQMDPVAAVDVITSPETKKIWSLSDSWSDPEEIMPGNSGSEYIARFCNDREVLIALSDLGVVEEVEYFGETYQVWRAGSLWTADPTTFDSHCYQGQFLGFHSSKEAALNNLHAWAQENAEKLAEV